MHETRQILEHIRNGENFLLSGGAGSGKTYSLVKVILETLNEYPSAKIACMTYTNAAVKEIEERVNHSNLSVTTIHDFLWDNIKYFQKELKSCLIQMANDEEIKAIKIDEVKPISDDFFAGIEDGIQYRQFTRIKEGIISHDEVIAVADYIFKKYSKLSSIVKDKYKFIFIDEYQDTQEEVVRIFLEHFKLTEKRNVIGFFGDAMQSIYDDGVGNLDNYKGVADGKVREVQKKQNRRNPQKVIDLANKIRTDGLVQGPSDDNSAPNMLGGSVKIGEIQFLYSDNEDLDIVKSYLSWDFNNSKKTKELNLTHNLIADKAQFRSLMDIYDKDQILNYKKRIRDYIRKNSIELDFSGKSFGDVISLLKARSGVNESSVNPTPTQQSFIDDNPELYSKALAADYEMFSKIYVDKDQLLDDKKQDEGDENRTGSKKDSLIKHLFRLQKNIFLYQSGNYNEFLQFTDFQPYINYVSDKKALKEKIDSLIMVNDKTIETVIEEAHTSGICVKDDGFNRFVKEKRYVYDRVKQVPFREFQKLYEYLEGRTPFTTKHKTKGAEFDNVLVILNNGDWNNYNFQYLFAADHCLQALEADKSKNRSKIKSFPKILSRSQKIFYVCCTRTKERLAVYYHSPSQQVIDNAKVWFGEENVKELV